MDLIHSLTLFLKLVILMFYFDLVHRTSWSSVIAPASYSGGPRFRDLPEIDYPDWDVSWFSSFLSGECRDNILKFGDYSFLIFPIVTFPTRAVCPTSVNAPPPPRNNRPDVIVDGRPAVYEALPVASLCSFQIFSSALGFQTPSVLFP
jgi:hypothetical protein